MGVAHDDGGGVTGLLLLVVLILVVNYRQLAAGELAQVVRGDVGDVASASDGHVDGLGPPRTRDDRSHAGVPLDSLGHLRLVVVRGRLRFNLGSVARGFHPRRRLRPPSVLLLNLLRLARLLRVRGVDGHVPIRWRQVVGPERIERDVDTSRGDLLVVAPRSAIRGLRELGVLGGHGSAEVIEHVLDAVHDGLDSHLRHVLETISERVAALGALAFAPHDNRAVRRGLQLLLGCELLRGGGGGVLGLLGRGRELVLAVLERAGLFDEFLRLVQQHLGALGGRLLLLHVRRRPRLSFLGVVPDEPEHDVPVGVTDDLDRGLGPVLVDVIVHLRGDVYERGGRAGGVGGFADDVTEGALDGVAVGIESIDERRPVPTGGIRGNARGGHPRRYHSRAVREIQGDGGAAGDPAADSADGPPHEPDGNRRRAGKHHLGERKEGAVESFGDGARGRPRKIGDERVRGGAGMNPAVRSRGLRPRDARLDV